jgi:23S rRNA pseudouridine1911/1915/1917 synthase
LNDQLVVFDFDEDEPQRLDKFLVSLMPKFSRSRIQSLIKNGHVSVSGDGVVKTGYKLTRGVIVQVHIPPVKASELIPEDIPLDVIFENDDLIVVNKTAGMVVHPAAGHSSGTLVHAALAHSPELKGVGGVKRPGVVHRLDKDTSGLILLAKNDRSHQWLQDQFRFRNVKKIYFALVDGHPPTPQGRVEAAIGRSTTHRSLMAVVAPEKGREAISEYFTLEKYLKHTLLEVHPITGRTHQIRLHMAFVGCPIAGDQVYGRRHSTISLNRQFLHATRLTIQLLGDSQPRTFDAPMPDELMHVLEELKGSS